MLIHAFHDTLFDDLLRHLNRILFVGSEGMLLVLEPWKYSLVNVALELWFEHVHA